MNAKSCLIVNGRLGYVLHVDGRSIGFDGAVSYFVQHYLDCGYNVQYVATHSDDPDINLVTEEAQNEYLMETLT